MQRKLPLILVIFLTISTMVLSGGMIASASPALFSASSPENPVTHTGLETGQNSTWWIHIDPRPEITNTSIRISGTTNLPEGTSLNPVICLSSRNAANDTFGHIYRCIWENTATVMTVNGTGVWSMTADTYVPEPSDEDRVIPDWYTVKVYDFPDDVYTTLIVPASLPSLTEPEGSYWVQLDPVGNQTLEEPFALNGTTSLPEGYTLVSEVYSGTYSSQRAVSDDYYRPVLADFITVGLDSDGNHVFSVPVNFSGHREIDGKMLKSGEFFTEVHAINTNSTVSDNRIFNISSTAPLIHIDPIQEPVRGTNITITGTTSLSPGQQVNFYLATELHPCPTYSTPPDYDTESICGGSSCSWVSIYQPVTIETGPDNSGVWKFETGTSNWCLHEHYFVSVTYGEDEIISKDSAYFNIRAS